MKLVVLRDNLKAGLDVVGRAASQNLNLPILGNVLISAEEGEVKLTATSLELAITQKVSGKVVEAGKILVPHQTLTGIINNSLSERINLETTKQGTLSVKGDNYEASLQLANTAEFPAIPKIDPKGKSIFIDSAAIKDALTSVVVAAEASDLRPEISGVLLLGEMDVLKVVATDSFRLAEVKVTSQVFKNKTGEGFKLTIPLKTAQELTRILKDEGEASFSVEKNQLFVFTEETSLNSRLIEGNFPDYQAIIPKGVDTEILLDRGELVGALRLSSAFAGRTNDVRLKTKDKMVEIYSSDSAIGENNYLIPAKIKGPPTEAVFNWRFLLDGIKTGTTKEVYLGLNGSEKPALIKNPEDESYLYILMPIKA